MKILIATDGSEASKSVIETVCQLVADAENTAVKIISVVGTFAPMVAEPFALSAEYYAEMEKATNEQANSTVERAGADLKRLCPNLGEVSTEVLFGHAAEIIVEAARRYDADLIVVGSHGYGFWSRALLGSISNSVVHHAPCSVLIVRGKNQTAEPSVAE